MIVRRIFWTLFWVCLGTLGYVGYHNHVQKSPRCACATLSESSGSGAWFKEPRKVYNATLKDTQNSSFRIEDLKGNYTILFFGFTRCQLICPNALQTMSSIYADIKKLGYKDLPKFLFVSVDTPFDTPNRVKRFVSSFDASFQGACGSSGEIEKLSKSLGVVYLETKDAQGNASIDHSSAFILLNPNAEYIAVFTSPYDVVYIRNILEIISKKPSQSN